MLAALVLSLGLPTLVVLNMADDLGRRGGGGADAVELSEQLGTPVGDGERVQGGTGLDKVFQSFWRARPRLLHNNRPAWNCR